MVKTVGKRNIAKASTAKPSGKPPPGGKSLGLDPAIRLYLIENGDNTEEG